jgi:hypothetical protein
MPTSILPQEQDRQELYRTISSLITLLYIQELYEVFSSSTVKLYDVRFVYGRTC